MKISIVTPIYNENKNIHRFFESIKKLEYPKGNLELILINDGSTDNSLEILQKEKDKTSIKTKIINLKKNSGRTIARETGAKNTTHNNLLFLDCKCELFPDAIKKIEEYNYQPLVGHVIQANENIFGKFLQLIRQNFHKNEKKDSKITPKNFDNKSKGTGIFLCDKTLFLNSQIKNKTDKNSSDDTKLLWNIVQKKYILSASKVKVFYHSRTSFKENIKHIFNRGPKFVDYYYTPSKKDFWVINFTILSLLTVTLLITQNLFLLELLITAIVLNTMIALVFAQSIKDFIILFTLFPIFSTVFFAGIIKGLFIKAFNTSNG